MKRRVQKANRDQELSMGSRIAIITIAVMLGILVIVGLAFKLYFKDLVF